MSQQAWLTQSGSGVTGHLRQVHRGHGLYTEIIESRKRVRSRPARSSTGVCYRGAPHQCPRGSNASRRVCSLTKGALYALGLIGQVYSLHHPVGKSLVWRQPFTSAVLRSRQRAGLRPWSSTCSLRKHAKHGRDRAEQWLGLPPPGAVLASSPPDPWRAWEHGGVSGQRESQSARILGTNCQPKIPAGHLPSWPKPMQWGALSSTTET